MVEGILVPWYVEGCQATRPILRERHTGCLGLPRGASNDIYLFCEVRNRPLDLHSLAIYLQSVPSDCVLRSDDMICVQL